MKTSTIPKRIRSAATSVLQSILVLLLKQ